MQIQGIGLWDGIRNGCTSLQINCRFETHHILWTVIHCGSFNWFQTKWSYRASWILSKMWKKACGWLKWCLFFSYLGRGKLWEASTDLINYFRWRSLITMTVWPATSNMPLYHRCCPQSCLNPHMSINRTFTPTHNWYHTSRERGTEGVTKKQQISQNAYSSKCLKVLLTHTHTHTHYHYPLVNLHNYGKSPFLMGKLTINGDFQ